MSRKILIIDNSGIENPILSDFLKNHFTILEADSGKAALALLHREFRLISAVILDIVMPGVDGFDMLQKIRRNALFQSIPVIVTAGLDGEASHERVMAMGANAFVIKPYSHSLLLHTVQNAVTLCERSVFLNAMWRDRLTGLLNRETFFTEAERHIAHGREGDYVLACMDVDNFKLINDQYGSDKGDETLRHIADTLKDFIVRENKGIASRMTADKFAILYPAFLKDSEAIRENHAKVMSPGCLSRKIRVRIGRYVVNDCSLPVSAMYDRAILAERSIRDVYGDNIVEYDESMLTRLVCEQHIVNDMARALAAGEFEPWFQPQYNHATGALIGAEALVRWKKNGEFISPVDFVPIFERNGFIYEMDQSIWEQVCIWLRKRMDAGYALLPVSINISRRDLLEEGLVPTLVGIAERYAVPYDLLRLEITESAFAASSGQIIARVEELVQRGFIVEIDDFGSGYSSLNTLKDVPATVLKLDMRFFENTKNQQRSGSIIESVARMAKWLGMVVIAEGVEDRAQADYLKSIGCCYIQGYYYARPMPAEDYEVLLDASTREPALPRLQTLDTLDTNEFWNPKSMETLIFNSYVGGACIFEFHNGKFELLRVNDRYIAELNGLIPQGAQMADSSIVARADAEAQSLLLDTVNRAITTSKEASCEIRLADAVRTEYIRATMRVIAMADSSYLFYCVIVNVTEQHDAVIKQLEIAQRFNIVMNNINGGVSAIQIRDDATSTFIFTNDKYYELYGYTREQAEAEQLDVMQCIVPEDLPSVMAKVKQIKADGLPTVINYCCVRRDGRRVYLRANCSLMHMDGYSDVIASVITDVTEQRTLNDKFRAVVDNINGGVSATYLCQDTPRFLIVNDRYFDIIGYTREQFVAEVSNVLDLIHPDDRVCVEKRFREAAALQRPYTMEYRMIRRDGAVRHILCNTNVIHLFGIDEPVQLAVSNDITDLRAAQRQEREMAGRLDAVLNHAGDGIIAMALRDSGPEVLFANDRFFAIFGHTRETYAGATQNDMLAPMHPDDRERVRREVLANVTDGSADSIYRVVRPDGKTVWVKAVVTTTHLAGEDAPVQISVLSDITAEREGDGLIRFLNTAAHDILAQPDAGQAVSTVLHRLITYFAADRGYVVELDYDRKVSSNTYEVCAPGVRPEKDRLQKIPMDVSSSWFTMLTRNQCLVIDDVSGLDDSEAELRQMLSAQDIHSIIIAPLWRDGLLIGFAGVDNPTRFLRQIDRLTALADYVAILLTRRDLTRKVENQQCELLDNLPTGAALYVYDGKTISPVHINRCYWKLVERAPVVFSSLSIEDVVHPGDRAVIHQELDAAIRQQRPGAVDIRIRCGDSGYRAFHVAANVAPQGDGTCLVYCSYIPLSSQAMSVQEMLPIALSTMMSASEDLSYVKDRDLRYICCSRSVIDMLGLDGATDLAGRTDADLFDAAVAQRIAADDMEIIRSGASHIGEMERFPQKNGEVRLFCTSKYPLLDVFGNVIGVYGVSRDITAQREKESRLELLAGSIPCGLATFACSPDATRLVYCNDGFLRLFGYDREEFVQRWQDNTAELVFAEDRAALTAQMQTLIREATPVDCVYRIHVRGGGYKWINLKAAPAERVGNTVAVNTVLIDITEQQEEKELLRRHEEEYRLAAEHSKHTICRYNIAACTLEFSEETAMRLSLPRCLPDVPYGRVKLGLISPDTVAAYTAFYERLMRGDRESAAIFRKKLPTGWRWISAHATAIPDQNGQAVSAIISYVDVTDQQEKEAIYKKWRQNLRDREPASYMLYRFNLNKDVRYETKEGALLDFLPEEDGTQSFNERVNDLATRFICEEDQAAYIRFRNSDTMLASYYRGKRAASMDFRANMPGGVRWLRLSVELVEYPNSTDVQAYLLYEDINDDKVEEIQTRTQARTDPLTGLLNRKAFEERVEQSVPRRKNQTLCALFLLDMDGFKAINDQYGHAAGDRALMDTSAVMRSMFREKDSLCRMGGDEFLIWLRDMPDREAILDKARQLCALMRTQCGPEGGLPISVGIAICPDDGTTFADLYYKADTALYHVKRHGKDGYALYGEAMGGPETEAAR